MPAEQWCGGKAYSGVPSAWYKATVAIYNNRTTRGSVPDASGGPPWYHKSQQ